MTKDEALRMALEALEDTLSGDLTPYQAAKTITDIRKVLAQPEQPHNGMFFGTDGPAFTAGGHSLAEQPAQQQEPEYKGWYCAHCQRGVDGSEVTYYEQHTVCGRVITDDVPPAQQQATMTKAQEEQIAAAILEALIAHGVVAKGVGATWPMLLNALNDFKNSAQQQEPVAWASPNVIPLRGARDNHTAILTPFKCEANTVPLYTTPQPAVPERKPLTDEEIWYLWERCSGTTFEIARAVEAAHGINGKA